MNTLKTVLMERDELTDEKADEAIADGRESLMELLENGDFESAFDFMSDEFGLEPDYFDDLI